MSHTSRLRRTLLPLAAAAAALTLGATQAQAQAHASAAPAVSSDWHVVNAPSTVPWRTSPNWDRTGGSGFADNDAIHLVCADYGGPAGPYSNTLWYWATDVSRGTTGFINDHYLNTPGTASSPQPQTGDCNPGGVGTAYDSGNRNFHAVNAGSGGSTLEFFRNSPGWNDTNIYSAFLNGDAITLHCYLFGGAAGSYGNTLWYLANDPARGGSYGWINDHWLSTPGTAASPQPQTGHC
jgi:hypothetical protein